MAITMTEVAMVEKCMMMLLIGDLLRWKREMELKTERLEDGLK
jgi:hypothetical protein